ncbi:MAG TPA: CHASE domain-containing protein [Opitutus sp.]|nr:CHASE domain-containing protein [Opitutus sp.]
MPPLPIRTQYSKRLYLTIALVVAFVGTLLSVRIYHYSQHAEKLRIESDFNRRTEVQNAFTRENIFHYESGVYALKGLFDGSDTVTREDFRRVSSEVLGRYPGITALEWVPAVAAEDRPRIEAQASRELGQPFQFTERSADGSMVRASPRGEHYPILYLEPILGNEAALGYDLQSAPTLPYLHEARQTQRMAVTSQFQLVQRRTGIVIAWPIYTERRENEAPRFRGFIQGVFRIEEMFKTPKLISGAQSPEAITIDDTATDARERLLYRHLSGDATDLSPAELETEFRNGLHREYVIEFGGRRWVSLYRPNPDWYAAQISRQPGIRLAVGLLVTALFAGLVGAMGRQTYEIRQQVEERTAELSESRRQLSSLLHALPGMAYRCTYHDRLTAVYLSDGALELTGYPPEAFTSQQIRFRDLIHPDDLERVRTATRNGLQDRHEVEVEYRIRPRTGPEKWILSRGRGVHDEQDELLFFEGLAIDVTARKQAETDKLTIERKLLETQKLESLGLLAGGIAHDFNNLLTGIMGHANLARFHPDVVEGEIIDHLRKIESGAIRAAELCQQMLAYSGRGKFLISALDLNHLVRETLPLLQGSLSSRAMIQLRLADQPLIVMADATQLRQIAMNLILNASDALGASGGEIFVTSGRRYFDRDFLTTAQTGDSVTPGEYVFLEIRDTGTGMDSETMSKIFDPFFTTKFTGRGLGLAAVLGIVRGHSGALRVRSEIDCGSSFTLILPPSTEVIASDSPSSSSTPWRCPGKVLVIDDEESVRNVAAALLHTFGLTVVTASNGTEGIELFRETAFDLVLLDLTMPGLSGEETLHALRTIVADVRVLLVSGYSENDRVAEMAVAGPLLFLQKPFTRRSLEQKLQEILLDCVGEA